VSVPPLRTRAEDIPDLARHFVARFAAEEGKPVHGIEAEAMRRMIAFNWPGNVRQLENAIFRAVVMSEGDEIGVGELPQIAHANGATVGEQNNNPVTKLVSIVPESAPSPAFAEETARAAALTIAERALPLLDRAGDVRPFDEIERDVIRFAIAHYRGQMSEVARRLKIGRSTLYRKLEGLGIEDAPTSVPAE
jgi:DNA-binding NtrC family response regulator